MAKELKLRRGTTAEHAGFTGAIGEVTVDTTKDVVVVHDGLTAGGFPGANAAQVAADINAAIAALDTAIAAAVAAGYVAKTGATKSAVLPVGTTAQRDTTPQKGYLRFNDSLSKPEVYDGTAWGSVGGGGATGGANDTVFNENSKTITASYTLTAGKNAVSVGPITIAPGAIVTVPAGQRWVIL